MARGLHQAMLLGNLPEAKAPQIEEHKRITDRHNDLRMCESIECLSVIDLKTAGDKHGPSVEN